MHAENDHAISKAGLQHLAQYPGARFGDLRFLRLA